MSAEVELRMIEGSEFQTVGAAMLKPLSCCHAVLSSFHPLPLTSLAPTCLTIQVSALARYRYDNGIIRMDFLPRYNPYMSCYKVLARYRDNFHIMVTTKFKALFYHIPKLSRAYLVFKDIPGQTNFAASSSNRHYFPSTIYNLFPQQHRS